MKAKYLMWALIPLMSGTAMAAAPVEAIDVPAGSHHPVLSPDGSTLLFSTQDHQGLKSIDLASGRITTIDGDAAAGFSPVFSLDGKTVFYRTAVRVDGLTNRDVRSYSFVSGKGERLQAPSRNDVDLHGLGGGDYAFADYKEIKVVNKGMNKAVKPLADAHSYLWASLSPDGGSLLFTEPFKGVYVSTPDGSGARKLIDKGDYASWAGGNWIVAVVSHDDGYVVTDSKLVAVNVADGTTVTLTPDSVLVGEATASSNGTVVYTDLEGRMFKLILTNALNNAD